VRGTRESFPARVRDYVAREVHYTCSHPDCGAPTIGPSGESGKLTDIGVAAHITAASPLGPRYDASLTTEQRRSATNAIWMCQTHAKAIDDDTSTHSPETLREWKRVAVRRAEQALRLGNTDPDGRRRLAIEAEQGIARRGVRAAIESRGTILRGIAIAEYLCKSPIGTNAWHVGLTSTKEWLERLKAAKDAIDDALLDVRVQFGGEALVADRLVKLYVWLVAWGNRFSENVQSLVKESSTAQDSQSDELWDWDMIFRGDAEHKQRLVHALDAMLTSLEAWATPIITGRYTSIR
jgi:hypothetical protein